MSNPHPMNRKLDEPTRLSDAERDAMASLPLHLTTIRADQNMDAMDSDEPTSAPSRVKPVLTLLALMTVVSAGLAFLLAPYV